MLASNRGAPKHPSWYYNRVANADAMAEIGEETFLARARIAVAEERTKLLRRILDETPGVAIAIDRAPREIPVVILDLRTASVRPDGALMTTR